MDHPIHLRVVVEGAVKIEPLFPSCLGRSTELSDKQFDDIRELQTELRSAHREMDVLLLGCGVIPSRTGKQ